jgi:hypothetical protein
MPVYLRRAEKQGVEIFSGIQLKEISILVRKLLFLYFLKPAE